MLTSPRLANIGALMMFHGTALVAMDNEEGQAVRDPFIAAIGFQRKLLPMSSGSIFAFRLVCAWLKIFSRRGNYRLTTDRASPAEKLGSTLPAKSAGDPPVDSTTKWNLDEVVIYNGGM
jgi:hypothetical protein